VCGWRVSALLGTVQPGHHPLRSLDVPAFDYNFAAEGKGREVGWYWEDRRPMGNTSCGGAGGCEDRGVQDENTQQYRPVAVL
jgi:hypothetical protein